VAAAVVVGDGNTLLAGAARGYMFVSSTGGGDAAAAAIVVEQQWRVSCFGIALSKKYSCRLLDPHLPRMPAAAAPVPAPVHPQS